jgi:eukaryotic-like serine/threonine-protein kinase
MALAKGTRLGPYEIQAAIGSGGMGEVYRARDTRLSRDVAIKILPSAFSNDADRRLRFEREARAVASLSHPNIVSLFDTGVHDGQLFAVMELLDGETLRQRLSVGALPVRKAIDYGVQIARGLGAAHEKGLIHRDLKPENVFLLRDGHVKILDFGLARETLTSGSGETGTAAVTDPGTVMGTVGYMSPEQVRGQDVDARSDLFSFGAVLYEMVGGQRAFRRQTAAETMTAILKDDPPELAGSRPDLSPALDRIVRHCLEKNPGERFQSARDVAFAIEALSGSDTSRSGAQPVTPPPRTRSRVLVLSVIILLVAAGAYGLYQSGRTRQDPPLTISRVTFTGTALNGAISPDGKYVAYVQDDDGRQSLWLSQLAISNHRQLLPDAGDVLPRSVTFSPDGQFVYFVRGEGPQSALFQLPFTGGEPRRVRAGVNSSISFSPDGKHFAFLRGLLTANARRDLVIATTGSEEERLLATRQLPRGFGDTAPAWSPDGRIVAVSAIRPPSGLSVLGVRVTDGSEEPILSEGKLGLVRHLTWLPGGKSLIAMASPRRGEPPGIWRVTVPGDTATKLTDDLTVYEDGLSVAADGTAVTVARQRIYNIWLGEDEKAKRLTAGPNREDGFAGLAWTPDGKVLYRSTAGGRPGLWMMNADGLEERQLDLPAAATQARDPAASPDGRYLLWVAFQGDDGNIWRMNRDGTNPIALTKGALADSTQVSADGRFVIYTGWNAARDFYTLWKVSIDGGEPTPLLDVPARFPAPSPDGKFVAIAFTRPVGPNRNRYGLVPIEGGAVKPIEGTSGPTSPIAWSPDGRALATVRTANGVTNLWSVPLDGSPTRQLTRFTEMTIQRFAWSKDGKLAVSRGTSSSDIVLIRNLSR